MDITTIYQRFPNQEACISHLEKVRWSGTPICPYCKSSKNTPAPDEQRYHCNNCNTSFSVTVGTIFHKTHLDLQKWFLAIALVLNAKKGISARQLSRDIQVNKNTAWYMGMRIRRAMFDQGELLRGIVEMDETYIGGKPRKGDPPAKRGRGTKKTPVVGIVERNGKVKAKVAGQGKGTLTSKNLRRIIKENVDTMNAIMITDEFKGYLGINKFMEHHVIDHQKGYVDGKVHTNTIESFWALLKRGIVGQYHKVSVRHLNKYIAEFCYRQNNRDSVDIFGLTLQKAVGGLNA